MSGELVHVRYNDRFVLCPSRTADTFIKRNTHTGDGSLKRSEDEFVVHDAIEARPQEMEGVMKDSGDIRHIGDEVRFVGDKCLDLRDEGFVGVLFVFFKFSNICKYIAEFEFVVEMRIGICKKRGILFVRGFLGGFIVSEPLGPHIGFSQIFGRGEFGMFGGFFDVVCFLNCHFH